MQQITGLNSKLTVADEDAIIRCVRALVRAGFRTPPQIAEEDLEHEYLFALRGVSIGALERTALKLKRGELPVTRKEFLPIPAALANFCHDERAALAASVTELRKSDPRRLAIWNQLPEHYNNRQKEEAIDRLLMQREGLEVAHQ